MTCKITGKSITFGLLGLFLFIIGNMTSYPMVFLNRGGLLFTPSPTIQSMGSDSQIDRYIVEGAGNFFKAYSNTLLALQKIETASLPGVDYNDLRWILKNAIGNMSGAVSVYRDLKTMTENTPYNPVMIEKLRAFDYDTFGESKGLNGFTLENVEKYLTSGDVRGVFSKISNDSESLLKMLQEIYKAVDAGSFPDIQALWQLNRVFSETLQFGQISAEVFYEISK